MNLPVACIRVFLRFLLCMCAFCGSEAARCISLWDGGQVKGRRRRVDLRDWKGQEMW